MITLNAGQHAVYQLSFPNGKKYIGVTNNLRRRLYHHKNKKNTIVSNAIRKYGNPAVVILAICDLDYACFLEKRAIEVLDTMAPHGYNLKEGGFYGGRMSKEARKNMSRAHKGRDYNKQRIQLRKAQKNRIYGPHSDETKAKISKSLRGRTPSVETRKKLSAARLGKKRAPFSAEWRENMAKAKKGKPGNPHTEESKRKIGEKNRIHGLGRKMSDEIRQKISVALTGKKKSLEHKINISKARLRMNVKADKTGEVSHG